MKGLNINWRELGRVFIAIDAANLEYSAKDLKKQIRYAQLYDYFKKELEALVGVHFYTARFGSKSHDGFLTFLKTHQFKLITKPLKIIQDREKGEFRKANFDVEITADVMDRVNEFESLILFSGDSDFDYLVKLLKAKRKRVFIISSRYHVSRELVNSASKYVDLKRFNGVFLQ